MDPRLQVRIFTDADAPALTGLLHAAYAPLGAQGLNYTAVDQDDATTLRRASAGRCWLVHQHDVADEASSSTGTVTGGRLVGTLTMSLPPSSDLQSLTAHARTPRRAWLNQVAVDPTLQRSGIASSLWELAMDWAARAGATSVGVDTAAPAEHLVRLYGAWGFAHRDLIQWPGKTYDSVVMTRPLHPPHSR